MTFTFSQPIPLRRPLAASLTISSAPPEYREASIQPCNQAINTNTNIDPLCINEHSQPPPGSLAVRKANRLVRNFACFGGKQVDGAAEWVPGVSPSLSQFSWHVLAGQQRSDPGRLTTLGKEGLSPQPRPPPTSPHAEPRVPFTEASPPTAWPLPLPLPLEQGS